MGLRLAHRLQDPAINRFTYRAVDTRDAAHFAPELTGSEENIDPTGPQD